MEWSENVDVNLFKRILFNGNYSTTTVLFESVQMVFDLKFMMCKCDKKFESQIYHNYAT